MVSTTRSEDPRIARTQAAVLGAAAELVVEGGPGALRVDSVATRSGVAKSTIYRHWPTRDDLVRAVFEFYAPAPEVPDPDLGFADAMRVLLHGLVAQFAEPHWARMIPALLSLKAYEPALYTPGERLDSAQRAVTDAIFERGERDRLFGAELDRDRALALLVGPLVFAVLTGSAPISDDLADAALDSFLAGLATRGRG